MAAPTSYPSWAYNSAGQPALIVASLTAFNALAGNGTWSATPFAPTPTPSTAPYDSLVNGTGILQVIGIRLEQMLIENRVQSQLMQFGFNIADDPVTQIRPDILLNDSSLTS